MSTSMGICEYCGRQMLDLWFCGACGGCEQCCLCSDDKTEDTEPEERIDPQTGYVEER